MTKMINKMLAVALVVAAIAISRTITSPTLPTVQYPSGAITHADANAVAVGSTRSPYLIDIKWRHKGG